MILKGPSVEVEQCVEVAVLSVILRKRVASIRHAMLVMYVCAHVMTITHAFHAQMDAVLVTVC
jgi:hypothetical protein